MPAARSFTDLQFWQRARQWSKTIFERTQQPPFSRDQRLAVQINDSSESVMSNMAEGFGRGTQEEFITFLGYALGSLDETESHLCAAYDRHYLDKDQFASLWSEGIEIRKMTVAFIRAMILPRGGVRTLGRPTTWSSRVWEIYERVTGNRGPIGSKKLNLIHHSHPATTNHRRNLLRTRYSVRSTEYGVPTRGDLVLEPTCGNGTTPFVAKQWGRPGAIRNSSADGPLGRFHP